MGRTAGWPGRRLLNQNGSSAKDVFAILLKRNGPMVQGVCCRLLPDRYIAAVWAETVRGAWAGALIEDLARFVTTSPAAGALPAAITALAEGVIQMMSFARLKPLVAVVAVLVLATAGVAVQGRQGPASEGGPEPAKTAPPPAPSAKAAAGLDVSVNQALAQKQVALIDQVLSIIRKLAQNGRIDLNNPSIDLWEHRRLEALRRAGAGKAEMIEALEKYLDRAKQDEAIAEALRAQARATIIPALDAQFRRLEAEIWLNEEKAR